MEERYEEEQEKQIGVCPMKEKIFMYIIYHNGKFELSEAAEFAVAKIEAPIYVENGEEKQLMAVRRCRADGEICKDTYTFLDAENLVEIAIEKKNDTLFYIRRSWKKSGGRDQKYSDRAADQALFWGEKAPDPQCQH